MRDKKRKKNREKKNENTSFDAVVPLSVCFFCLMFCSVHFLFN